MDKIEVRATSGLNTDGREIYGYALKFNIWSTGLPFKEMILPEAITQSFIDSQDVMCKLNHNDNMIVLARSKRGVGSLKLKVDSTGLFYSFIAKPSPLSEEVLQMIKAGELTESSFAFHAPEDGVKTYRDNNNTLCRIISKIDRLTDVSPCYNGAYASSSVAAREQDIMEAKKIKDLEKNLADEVKDLKKQEAEIETKEAKDYKYDHRYDYLKWKSVEEGEKKMEEFRKKYVYSEEKLKEILYKEKYNEAFMKDEMQWLKDHPELAERAKEKREEAQWLKDHNDLSEFYFRNL